MKSMIIVVAFLALGAVYAEEQDRKQVCLRGDGDCDALKTNAKAVIVGIRESRTGDLDADIPVFFEKLRELFTLTAKHECHVDICKCEAGALKCVQLLEKVKTTLNKFELPECMAQSDKAKELLDKFRTAVASGDRQVIADAIGELGEGVQKAFADKDFPKIQCLKSTVTGLKTAVKSKLKKFDLQPSCDFCVAPTVVA